jgi:hypothetical protein
MTIAAAFTDGDSDRLMVGRNGVFYDRKGRDWDATITKIITNPISMREAFWGPYKKAARFVEELLGKRAAAADAESQAKLTSAATASTRPEAVPHPGSQKIDVGTVAAIGVAVGGLGALVTGVLSTFFGLGLWMPIGFAAVLLIISGPSMLLAYLKLRLRNLGPILDASGWAVNGRAAINVPFGGALTDVATLPAGSRRSLDDPYAERHRPWRAYLVLAVVLLVGVSWYLGRLDRFLPARAQRGSVMSTLQSRLH